MYCVCDFKVFLGAPNEYFIHYIHLHWKTLIIYLHERHIFSPMQKKQHTKWRHSRKKKKNSLNATSTIVERSIWIISAMYCTHTLLLLKIVFVLYEITNVKKKSRKKISAPNTTRKICILCMLGSYSYML